MIDSLTLLWVCEQTLRTAQDISLFFTVGGSGATSESIFIYINDLHYNTEVMKSRDRLKLLL